MKKLLFILIMLASLSAYSQTDTTKLKTSLSLQVRDWLYLNSFLKNTPEFENVYDSMKVKLRVANSPTLTTTIKVDSIRNGQVIRLAQIMKQGAYGIVVLPYSRINTALRASSTWVATKVDAMDTDYITQYNTRVQSELDDLRSALQ